MTIDALVVEILTDPDVQSAIRMFATNQSHMNETALANAMRAVLARPRSMTVQ